jgi:hypothetical protein
MLRGELGIRLGKEADVLGRGASVPFHTRKKASHAPICIRPRPWPTGRRRGRTVNRPPIHLASSRLVHCCSAAIPASSPVTDVFFSLCDERGKWQRCLR